MASFAGNDISLRDSFRILLREGLPAALDSIGLGGPAGDTSTDTMLERRTGAGSAPPPPPPAPPAPDMQKTFYTAAAVVVAVGVVVWILSRVFK